MAITVREARQKAGLTMAKMADKMGISRPTYAKIEHDFMAMTLEQFFQVCRITDTVPENFLPLAFTNVNIQVVK